MAFFNYIKNKNAFESLEQFDDKIAFIEDTKEIYTHGNYWGGR